MTTETAPRSRPRKPMTFNQIRERLLDDRETLAMITLYASRLMARNDDLWEATQQDEPPEFSLRRAS